MRLNNSDTLSRWFSVFSLQQLPLMGWLKGLGCHVPTQLTPQVSARRELASFFTWREGLLLWLILTTTGEPVDPLPYTVVRQRAEETQTRDISVARNCTRIAILELESNLQKQIFLSERICLAFTPRNRPRAGSP